MVQDWVKNYKAINRRRIIYVLIIVILTALVSIYSLSISDFNITFTEAFTCLFNYIRGVPTNNHIEWIMTDIVINDNAPRTICGIAVGASLAVGGAVIQSITRNPLTDPYTIGISSAAMFGVTITVIFGFGVLPTAIGNVGMIVNAFLFSLVPSAVIIFIASFRKISSTMMILIGIALMYMFSAFTTFLKFNATDEDLAEIFKWGLGTMANTDWSSVMPITIAFIFLMIVMMILANSINTLSAGENISIALGVNPIRLRIICFVVVSIATAAAVCFTGTIGFVGLVAPHIARLFVGSNSKVLIPVSAIIGALTVLGADCLVRLLPGGLPVGVITAIIGSPLFIYFLYKQRKTATW